MHADTGLGERILRPQIRVDRSELVFVGTAHKGTDGAHTALQTVDFLSQVPEVTFEIFDPQEGSEERFLSNHVTHTPKAVCCSLT